MRIHFMNMKWAPNGRRILCTTNRGEFLLFNGHAFGLEQRCAAHEGPCKALAWSRINDLIVSGDDSGTIKVWLSNLNLVNTFPSNHRGVTEIAFSPTEQKVCTVGQDGSGRIWDTERMVVGNETLEEESRLEGHGGDIYTVDWHPFKSLVLTGSRDADCRLWDPRTASTGSIATIQGHHQPVMCVRWHRNGHGLLTASRDGFVRLWDIRKIQKLATFKGHTKDVMRVQWHPHHTDLFTSAGLDGSIIHWVVQEASGVAEGDGSYEVTRFAASMEASHETVRDMPNSVHAIAYSPIGHLLASCSHDVRFWVRSKPGTLEEEQAKDNEVDELR
jgi:WD40 repeat protein